MNNVIFKYILDSDNTITVPKDYKILKFEPNFNGLMTFWIQHELPKTSKTLYVKLKINILGTGHMFDKNEVGDYYTTYFEHSDRFVWHVFIKRLCNELC